MNTSKFDREFARRQMSAFLMNNTENNPFICSVRIGREDAMGLSDLELPEVISCYQTPDRIICFKIKGYCEDWEFDDLSDNDIEILISELGVTNKVID